MKKLLYITLVLAFFSSAAKADYINLTADKRVEWDSKNQTMTAVGNAVATKQDMKIRADKMTAHYSKGADKKTKSGIEKVHASGAVNLSSPQADGYGDTLDYLVGTDEIILKGQPAKIKTAKETITAKDSITYYPSKQMAVALGDVISKDAENQVRSDKMVAYFQKDATGKMQMDKVEIFGHITITTPNGNVNSDRGVYFPQTGIVKLYDRITLEQDGNKLHGDYAESNLNTGISRIIAGPNSGGRVSGVFKEKKSDNSKSVK